MLERLEQALDLACRDYRAGVADSDRGLSRAGGRGHIDLTLTDVVTDCVVEEVGDQDLDQAPVTGRWCRAECRGDVDAAASGLLSGREHGGRDVSEIDSGPFVHAALAGGQGEQRVDEVFLLLAEGESLLAGRAQRPGVRAGIGQRDLEQGFLSGEGSAQFMRRVGHEVPLRGEGRFQPREEPVQDAAEFGQFATQQTLQPYPQVDSIYTPANGYYPLAPWAGLAVLGGYALLTLGLAIVWLRRRDA